jgi:hypothetical protein
VKLKIAAEPGKGYAEKTAEWRAKLNDLSTAPRKWGTDLAVAHKQSRDREGADEGHDPYPHPFYGAAY